MIILPKYVNEIISTLEKNGYSAYAVGGCIRDLLLGKTPLDYDVTTNCPPETTAKLFEKTVLTGIKHGTVTVVTNEGNVEITTFRTDGGYINNRKPETVEFHTNLEQDLTRRDFTVNAMCYNEKSGLIDVFCGINDLKNKIIKTVGNPEKRFSEDALRILRALRFSSVLNFNIDENTITAMYKTANLLSNISRERIFNEISKTLLGDRPQNLEEFINLGNLKFLNIFNAKNLKLITLLPKKINIRLFMFCILCDINIQDFSTNLKLSNSLKQYLITMELLNNLNADFSSESIKKMLNLSNKEITFDYIVFYEKYFNIPQDTAIATLNKIIENKEPFNISMLNISGNDIKKLGYSGKEVGNVLNYLLYECIKNPDLNTYPQLCNLIKNFKSN